MKFPFNSSQTIAAVAVAAVLLAGAFALGRSQTASVPAPAPEPVAAAVAEPKPVPRPAPPKVEPAPVVAAAEPSSERLCNECARVVSVRTEQREGQASGIGVIGGAVIGGLLGNQVGGGTGKKIATVGGAVAGGYAGNEVEKRSKSTRVWIVRLSNRDGSTQTHEQAHDPQLRAGDVVTLRDGRLERR